MQWHLLRSHLKLRRRQHEYCMMENARTQSRKVMVIHPYAILPVTPIPAPQGRTISGDEVRQHHVLDMHIGHQMPHSPRRAAQRLKVSPSQPFQHAREDVRVPHYDEKTIPPHERVRYGPRALWHLLLSSARHWRRRRRRCCVERELFADGIRTHDESSLLCERETQLADIVAVWRSRVRVGQRWRAGERMGPSRAVGPERRQLTKRGRHGRRWRGRGLAATGMVGGGEER